MNLHNWDHIWEDQARFNRYFRHPPNGNGVETADQTKDMVLAMVAEAMELLETVAWKKHRDNGRHRPNMAHTTEELVDIFKFFVTLCQLHGVTPDVLYREYWRKSAVCEQRYIEEMVSAYARREPLGRVAFVDLDDTIFNYTESFGSMILGASDPESDDRDIDLTDETRKRVLMAMSNQMPLHRVSLGINIDKWELLKHLYRSTARTARMHLMPGAREILDALRDLEYLIIIVTARPIDRYPNLMTDTIEALNFHGLSFDHVWHGLSKKLVLAERLDPIPSVCMAVDDDPAHVQEYVDLGIPTFHVVNGSSWAPTPEGAVRVETLIDAVQQLSPLA